MINQIAVDVCQADEKLITMKQLIFRSIGQWKSCDEVGARVMLSDDTRWALTEITLS
jgi:hypothetical protein